MGWTRGWFVIAGAALAACSAGDDGVTAGGDESFAGTSGAGANGGGTTFGSSGTSGANGAGGGAGAGTTGLGGTVGSGVPVGGTTGVGTTGSGSPGSGSPGSGGSSGGETNRCGGYRIATGRTVPEIMIVLDRSTSMFTNTTVPNRDCQVTRDFVTVVACVPSFGLAGLGGLDCLGVFECLGAGVDCNDRAWAQTTTCGGTDSAPQAVDRWGPSVSAIKNLTTQLEGTVMFGLSTFPGNARGGNPAARALSCEPGSVDVPVGPNTSGSIAATLDSAQPVGATPTGPTLDAIREQFNNATFDPDRPPRPKYVLLVTDGAPTCPNTVSGRGGLNASQADRQNTIEAIDALAEARVKTYVVGYDAQLDPSLQAALNEFAQHGGTERYRPVQDEQSLVAELESIATNLVECTYSLEEAPPDPDYVKVIIDNTQLNLGDANGWSIDGATITVQGAACEGLQDGLVHDVSVTVECEPVVVF